MTDSSITDIKQHVCIWRAQKKSKFINKYNTYTLWSVRILTVPFNVVPQQQLCTWIWLISCENMNILDFRRFKLIKRLPYWCSKAAKIQKTPHNKEVINIFFIRLDLIRSESFESNVSAPNYNNDISRKMNACWSYGFYK